MTALLNPVQRLISEGVHPLVAFLTNATCGEACWHAKEEICRCKCGGKNHGCLRTADGVRPQRTCKIDGKHYVLRGVGDACKAARAINDAHPHPHSTPKYVCHWHDTERGAPARVKPATKQQFETWPELAAARDAYAACKATATCAAMFRDVWPVYLLWVREDVKEVA